MNEQELQAIEERAKSEPGTAQSWADLARLVAEVRSLRSIGDTFAFPFEYVSTGWWRRIGAPRGEKAPIIHGDSVVEWIRDEISGRPHSEQILEFAERAMKTAQAALIAFGAGDLRYDGAALIAWGALLETVVKREGRLTHLPEADRRKVLDAFAAVVPK